MKRALHTRFWLLAAVLLAASGTTLSGASTRAHASDFWDGVLSPGLAAWRRLIQSARAALAAVPADDAAAFLSASQALRLLPDRAEADVLLARIEVHRRQWPSARTRLVAALGRDADACSHPDDALTLGTAAALNGDLALSTLILGRAVRQMPETPERQRTYALYGGLLLAQGPAALEDAIAALREAVRASGQVDVASRAGLAVALARQGERFEALILARSISAASRTRLGGPPLPETERAAREAIVLTAAGDRLGATQAWSRAAATGPWIEHARQELALLGSPLRTPGEQNP